MTINLTKLKALAEAAKRDPYDHLAANDYGMSMPPATALELIAEIERHRPVNAEGCKPEISNRPAGGHTPDAPTMHGLDKADGCKPDFIIHSSCPLGEPADVQLIEIARKAAVDSVHRYSYMPTTPEDAKCWQPHRWVIEAMRAALELKP
ncbi:hypothetical protein [Pseudomonas guariconensis]|uniref:hypothetical protein n=1 Tax=Pseudomonas guariconensis TaxID=1288410 RepID=UPI00384E66EB